MVNHDTGELLQILDTPGRTLSPTLRARAQAIASNLMGPLRESYGMKTLTKTDEEIFKKVIADPSAIFSVDSATRQKLEVMKEHTNRNLSTLAEQAGLKYNPINTLPIHQRELANKVMALPDSDPRKAIAVKKLGL